MGNRDPARDPHVPGASRPRLIGALLAIALLIGLLWPVNALADITGKPRVIDGDTLEIA